MSVSLVRKLFFLIGFINFAISVSAKIENSLSVEQKLCFIENKGQIRDQTGNLRSDIRFYVQSKGFNVYLGNNQLHYQFSRISDNDIQLPSKIKNIGSNALDECDLIYKTGSANYYRVDACLRDANANCIVEIAEPQLYYENYYLPGCPIDGIHAHSFKKITYKDVYPDIDWVFTIKDNKLEYEFVVGPNGDASKIKLEYKGATSVLLTENNSLKVTTPMGNIVEQAPYCYTIDPVSKVKSTVPSAYRLEGNILSYELSVSNGLVIDPGIEWGTYYGQDSSVTVFYAASCDNIGHIYAGGQTYSTGLIATSGGFQSTIGGDMDAYLVKFDTAGNRIWATYYGSTGGEWATGVRWEPSGHVYIAGSTNSNTGMVTPGCQQSVYGGGMFNGFLAMFTTDGIRHWCTYLGGGSATEPSSLCTDNLGHVYITGLTNDGTNIATTGSYQPYHSGGHDVFLIQYDSLGVRRWGTYYGGPGDEYNGDVCTDASNNVYLSAWTSSASGISSPGSYQPAFGGMTDAFMAKFTSGGTRVWGTYFGGPSSEKTGAITVDKFGMIYLFGSTNSDVGISTFGSYQPARAGLQDAFLAKFDPILGHAFWSTYYGGPDMESTDNSRITSDSSGNVFITGMTVSTSGISVPGVWQTSYGGGDNDCFFAKYNGHGSQLWSSYLGGTDADQPTAIAYDGLNAYLFGTTHSTNNIATTGSFLSTGGGLTFYNQGFIVKILDFLPVVNTIDVNEIGSQMTLYPSRGKGEFFINGKVSSKSTQVIITDVTGKIIDKVQMPAIDGHISNQIKLPYALPGGMYFVKVIDGNNVSNFKFENE